MKNNIYYIIYKYLLLLYFLSSMNPWFFWPFKLQVLNAIFFVPMCVCVAMAHLKFRGNVYSIIACLLLIISGYFGFKDAFLGPIFVVLPSALFLLFTDSSIEKDVLDLITNFFAIILPISYFLFILSFLHFPSLGTVHTNPYPPYSNYILCIANAFYGYRFSAFFAEPGHLGMILSFILYANDFNMKDKRNIILLVAAFLTFSLAAFLLLIIGFSLYLAVNNKLKIKYIYYGLLSFFVAFIFAYTYNDGDNIINEHIFSRLEYDEEKGISGNNRIYGEADEYFAELFTSSAFWFGLGYDEYVELMEMNVLGGTGWKAFILQKGLLSLILVFFAYLFLGFSYTNDKRKIFGIFLLLSISFLQRSYPYWSSWLMIYACVLLKNDSKSILMDKLRLLLSIKKLKQSKQLPTVV